MKKNLIEANVVLAKCSTFPKTYGIRIERRMDKIWYCTWAFPLSEKTANNEGFESTMISGRVEYDPEYPGCPFCGTSDWVSCGKCRKITCFTSSDNFFTCMWCGNSGEVTRSDSFDLHGGDY